jgi:DNA-directed RNA polymerase subunit RPC12/RpoP
MSAQSGEAVAEAGDYRCERCQHPLRLEKGDSLPKCPNCGNERFVGARTIATAGGVQRAKA